MRNRLFSVVAAAVLLGALAWPVAGHGATTLEGVPRYDHVFTIVLENENFSSSWTGRQDPYLQSLRTHGVFADQYFGTGHQSADNYITMTSGQPATPLFDQDCSSWGACESFEKAWPDGGRNIADQIDDSGQSWKAYMDSMATPCQHGPAGLASDPYQTGYATRHDPFVYFPSIVENATRCNRHVVPYTQLAHDLASTATTPNYVFITPDTCHDGHDAPCGKPETGQPGGLTSADAWLRTQVPLILGSPAFTQQRSLLVITFDENGQDGVTDPSACCDSSGAIGGRIGLVAIGAHVRPNKVVHTAYDHWSLLRTEEDALGIGEHLNLSGLPTTHAMTDVFTR